MRIHKEGNVIIPVSGVILAIPIALGFWAHPILGSLLLVAGLVLFVLIVRFFRNPEITIPTNPNQILSPCEGKVVVIEEVEDPVYFKGKVRQISIFMSPLNIHVNRNPIGGVLKQVKYLPGQFLVAFNPKSSELNEQTFLVAENDRMAVGYKQIAGAVARRIRWYVKEGDTVKQGEEFGFIRFGSRVDLLIPLECKVLVSLEEKVKGGTSVIAELPG
jgi:phosphatidylserine decarboxylase